MLVVEQEALFTLFSEFHILYVRVTQSGTKEEDEFRLQLFDEPRKGV